MKSTKTAAYGVMWRLAAYSNLINALIHIKKLFPLKNILYTWQRRAAFAVSLLLRPFNLKCIYII